MGQVTLTSVTKRFGQKEVIPRLDLTIPDKSFTVLIGPSGSGKSTLLRMIAGLEDVTSGSISIDGRDVTHVDVAARGIALVFQSYALYPHMSVAANMGFPLKLARFSKVEISARVEEAAEILKLQDLLDRKPNTLSGGQRQRVAIGRAIVRKPKVFLFDEPLSNLDTALRAQMRVELAELQAKLGATMIYVTHEQVDAMTMAHQVVALRAGVVEQVGTPCELYERPVNTFVAQFIGSPRMNMLAGGLDERFRCHRLGVRPEHLRLDSGRALAKGVVQHVEYLGAETIAHVNHATNGRILVRLEGKHELEPGTIVGLAADPANMIRFNTMGQSLGPVAVD